MKNAMNLVMNTDDQTKLYSDEDLKTAHEWRLTSYKDAVKSFKEYFNKLVEINNAIDSINEDEIPFNSELPIFYPEDFHYKVFFSGNMMDDVNYYEESEERYKSELLSW